MLNHTEGNSFILIFLEASKRRKAEYTWKYFANSVAIMKINFNEINERKVE